MKRGWFLNWLFDIDDDENIAGFPTRMEPSWERAVLIAAWILGIVGGLCAYFWKK